MAAVHNSNNDQDSSNSQRNGTASPGGWHFPKSGLGTPDLFYSFSSTQHHGPTSTSVTTGGGSSSESTTQPAWFKPQGVAASNANRASSLSNNHQASTSSSTSATAVTKEEPDAGAGAGVDDDGDNADRSNAGNQQSKLNNKDNTGNEEGMYMLNEYYNPLHPFTDM